MVNNRKLSRVILGVSLPKLSRRDEAVAILIKHSEGFPDLFLGVGVFHLTRHHREELREVDCSVT